MQRTVFVFKMVKAEYSQLRDREFKVNYWHFWDKKKMLINVLQLNESWLKQKQVFAGQLYNIFCK